MPSNETRGDIRKAITSFIFWLARLLASLFKRPQPLEELPIVASGSQQSIALLQGLQAGDYNSQVYVLAPHPRFPARRHHLEANTNLQSDKKTFRDRPATLPINGIGTTPIAVTREKPLSNYPTGFRWTAPITRPEDDWDRIKSPAAVRSPTDKLQVHNGIGDLGTRRGFKGKPLIFSPPATNSMWSRSSMFLSLPKGFNFSPRSSSVTSLDGSVPSSPRTPLEAMASRMRSASVSVVSSWSSGSKTPVPTINEIDQDLQDLYDSTDPFDAFGETSFFVESTDPETISFVDRCNFGVYRKYGVTVTRRKQSGVAKKNATLDLDGLHKAFTNARMETAIYDLLTVDVTMPARAVIPVIREVAVSPASLDAPGHEWDVMDISVAAAASPTIVLTGPAQDLIIEDQKQIGEELVPPVSLDAPGYEWDVMDISAAAASPAIVLTEPTTPPVLNLVNEGKMQISQELFVTHDPVPTHEELWDNDKKTEEIEAEMQNTEATDAPAYEWGNVMDISAAAASPTIVLTGPTTQSADEDEQKICEEASVTNEPAPTPEETLAEDHQMKLPRTAFAEIQNTEATPFQVQSEVHAPVFQPVGAIRFSDPPTPACVGAALPSFVPQPFEYARFPKVMYEPGCGPKTDNATPTLFPGDTVDMKLQSTPSPTTAAQQRSSIRPLVLPAKVASCSSPSIEPLSEGISDRLEALEGIIALLSAVPQAGEME
ncbi:hypothetical protein H0H87_007113 [Tephrocybe sp. NHM501043]|nr:hypothetical protein H0H87_007113 [Tephrocybe sp. NHM501043]